MKPPCEVALEGLPYSNEHLHALKSRDLPICTGLEQTPDSNGQLAALPQQAALKMHLPE